MGLFSRKIDKVTTEEQRYQAAADQAARAEWEAKVVESGRAAAAEVAARQEAWAEKRARVRKVGTIKRIGRGQFRTTGWEIDVPDGSGRGRVEETNVTHTGTLGGFTPAELCGIAHGFACRCTRR